MSDDALTDVINAPVDKVVDALTSFETFSDWQASVMECEVLERDADGRGSLVRMKVDGKVKKFDTVVRYSYDLPNQLSWAQDSGDFKEYLGTYSFAPREDGGTDVSVDITAESNFFVPAPMKKLIKDQSLKNAMRELRKHVES
jgi:ribosome-associated toxin RatA of RatAB toxin-antitoxin module